MKFDTKKYAELVRIKITDDEAKKFEGDLVNILDYFKQLEELDTKNVEPVIGGTDLENVFREDKQRRANELIDNFPEKEDGKLKVPKIFE